MTLLRNRRRSTVQAHRAFTNLLVYTYQYDVKTKTPTTSNESERRRKTKIQESKVVVYSKPIVYISILNMIVTRN